MNNVYKFNSTEKFDFPKWAMDKALECVDADIKELNRKGLNVTQAERTKLAQELLAKKGMTFHFYYSGRITSKDVAALRPKEEKKEAKA